MSSLIMLEKKDNRAPDDYMELVLKEYGEHSVWGILTVDLPTAKSGSVSAYDSAPTMEMIKETREVCSDPAVPIAYWFCKSEKPVHPDSMQPFVIVKDDAENPLVVALAAGEFKTYPGEGAISGAAYYCIEYLNAQFEDLMDRASGDIEKLDAELSKTHTIKNLRNSLSDGDYLILALADEKGSIHIISKTALNSFDWGFTSNTLGWEKQNIPTSESPKEELGKKEPELTGMAARIAAAKAKKQANLGTTEKPASTSSVTTFMPTPTIAGTRTQDVLKPPQGATPDTHPQWFYTGPANAEKLKESQIRRAYQDAAGFVPDNYKDLPTVQRKKPKSVTTEPIKSLEGLKQIASVDPSKSSGERPPIITAQSLKFINEEVLPKYYDVNKRIIKSPWEAPKVEDRLAMFTDVTGLGDAAYGAPVALRRELIATPDAFLNWSIEMSAKIIAQQKKINELEAKLHEAGVRTLKLA